MARIPAIAAKKKIPARVAKSAEFRVLRGYVVVKAHRISLS